MIRSMTAFARAETRDELGELVWELRSVNHRYLEVSVRLPEELRMLEPVVRERISQRVSRGKIDCALRFRPNTGTNVDLVVNARMADQLLSAVAGMRERLPNSPEPSIMDVLSWPGVLEMGEQDLTPVQAAASGLLDQAMSGLVEAREREGERLAMLVGQRCDGMREQVERARMRMPVVIAALKDRLTARLLEVSADLDPQRIEQEMAILAQKMDVDEEMDRLRTHVDEVRRVLGKREPIGRRLDFLMQELNREANTLGSKSTDSETTAVSVEMKVLIEQMREQIQNIE